MSWTLHERSSLEIRPVFDDGELVELGIRPAFGGRLESAALRRISIEQLVAQHMQPEPLDDRTITDPGGYRKPDSFYQLVAEVFTAEMADGNLAAASAIALRANVPLPTVHRWLREARQRGYPLPTDGRTVR